MALIDWRDEFKIGIPDVDYEHENLIGLINELHENLFGKSGWEAVVEVFGELLANIAAHFALEEKVMREIGYDQYDDHKADHERLLDEIRDLMIGYEEGAFAAYEARLSEKLDKWFTDHFRTKDARLHGFLADRSQG